jgi:hypothetical protein
MCTEFIDLNKCYPKDDFCLTRIDKIIDFVVDSKMMALLDCFSEYHQIWLHKEDKEKISFITPFETYCYLRMPEGLRNAGPTFCWIMKAAMKEKVGIIIASRKKDAYISDIAETFVNMCEARLKMNPENIYFRLQGPRSSPV